MSLNTYITTTDIYKPIDNQRRIIQDMCISALLTPAVAELFTLKQIITPEWCNPNKITEYKEIPVQSVETRDLTNYNLERPHEARRTCPVINLSQIRSKTNAADNEHLSLFENMKIEAPCLVLDGDILLYYNGNLRALRNLLIGSFKNHNPPESHSICASHAVYLKHVDDQSKNIISMESHRNPCTTVQLIRDKFFRSSTHLSRAMHGSMTTYKFVDTGTCQHETDS